MHERVRAAQTLLDRDGKRDGRKQRQQQNIAAVPGLFRPLLQQQHQTRQEQRRQNHGAVVDGFEQGKVQLVRPDKADHEQRHHDSRHHIDQKDHMPGIGFGQIAAQNGPKGRRDHRKAAGHNGCHRVRPARKNHEHRCEHGRDQRTARKSLQGTKQDQFAEIAAERAGKARKRKRKRRPGEQPAQRQRAGQKSGQRNGDDFRDQIGGLNPAQPVFADAKR